MSNSVDLLDKIMFQREITELSGLLSDLRTTSPSTTPVLMYSRDKDTIVRPEPGEILVWEIEVSHYNYVGGRIRQAGEKTVKF